MFESEHHSSATASESRSTLTTSYKSCITTPHVSNHNPVCNPSLTLLLLCAVMIADHGAALARSTFFNKHLEPRLESGSLDTPLIGQVSELPSTADKRAVQVREGYDGI